MIVLRKGHSGFCCTCMYFKSVFFGQLRLQPGACVVLQTTLVLPTWNFIKGKNSRIALSVNTGRMEMGRIRLYRLRAECYDSQIQ